MRKEKQGKKLYRRQVDTMDKKMKSYRIYDSLDMRLEELDIPSINDDEVLIKVAASGICTTDIELYDGSMPYFKQGLSKRPMTAGHEWSGYIEDIGKNVTNVKKGDLVVGDISIGCGKCTNCLKGIYHLCDNRTELGVIKYDGSFAEYLKTEGKNVYKVPEGVSEQEAALTEPLATVLYATRRTGIDPGDNVLVFGDGPIGLLNAQLANYSGASKVAVVARKEVHRNRVEGWGIELINTSSVDLHDEILRLFGDKADVVFEDTGNPAAFKDAVNTVKPGGKLCALSITGKDKILVDMDYIVTRDITIVGVLASPNCFVPALNMMGSKKIDINGCISHKYPFEKVIEAFEFVRTSSGKERIKVLVTKG
jgi:threonine dehydrogenase-like Zn-dependent dehydrogenase